MGSLRPTPRTESHPVIRPALLAAVLAALAIAAMLLAAPASRRGRAPTSGWPS